MQRNTLFILVFLFVISTSVGIFFLLPQNTTAPSVSSFNTLVATSTQAVLPDLITLTTPLPNQKITSPVTISGEARGNWFFEASAPVLLKDSSGTVIASGHLSAQGDWTTTNFVPFQAMLTFVRPVTPTGTLVLMNDNPSGDPKKQKELNIPVKF